jgi:hypothetical protein
MRKRLRQFRELDKIAFIPPINLHVPNSTPVANSRATSAGTLKRADLEIAYRHPVLISESHKALMKRMVGEEFFEKMIDEKNAIQLDTRAIEHYAVHLPSRSELKKVKVAPHINSASKKHGMTRRQIVDKYKLPSIQIPKRITPSPSKAKLINKLDNVEHLDFALSAEPVIPEIPIAENAPSDERDPIEHHLICEKVGTVFPLEYFMDHERNTKLTVSTKM